MSGPDLRIGDTDRDAALQSLGEHFAVGRLTREEYDERAEAVWTAKTRGDLVPIFTDRPGAPVASPVRRSRRSGWPFPVAPFFLLLIGLIVLSAVTDFPFILIGLIAWLLLGRSRWVRRRRHARGRRLTPRGSCA
jgi:hypothetical protein